VLEGSSSSSSVASYSTHDLPVWHTPQDDLGGGSAWAAGMIHALHVRPVSTRLEALRRADLLSALCMETRGDFSAVTREQLEAAEAEFAGKEAAINSTAAASKQLNKTAASFGSAGSGNAAALARAGLPAAEEASAAIDATVEGLRAAGCLAILRVKNAESTSAAIARGVELAAMGCSAIEVTLDSPGWMEILSGLKAREGLTHIVPAPHIVCTQWRLIAAVPSVCVCVCCRSEGRMPASCPSWRWYGHG